AVKPSPAYDVETKLDAADFMDTMTEYMNQVGLEAYAFSTEGGVGQYEIDFYYTDILEMADKMPLLRLMAHQVAKDHNLMVTFMPKPFDNLWGSGAHFNMGLYSSVETNNNVFRDENKNWTKEAYAFTAGILRHADAITAISNPLVN